MMDISDPQGSLGALGVADAAGVGAEAGVVCADAPAAAAANAHVKTAPAMNREVLSISASL
jgi:hypothetical protein